MKIKRILQSEIYIQACTKSYCSRSLRLPEFLYSQHMKVTRLSALSADHLYPQEIIPDIHFCQRLSQTQGHNAVCSIQSTKNLNDRSGFEIATFRFVAQCLNQLPHRVPPKKPYNDFQLYLI